MRLTVITSVFNSEFFLPHFLSDIKRQTIFEECEFLFLDADSSDNSRRIILESALDHKNIQYFNIGKSTVYQAWNFGVSVSDSPLLTNWNTDDRRLPNSLEKQVRVLEENPEYDLSYGRTLWVDAPNLYVEQCDFKNQSPCFPATLETMLQWNSPHCLPVWRRSLHEKFGYFDTKYFSAADYDLWMRAISGGSKFAMIDEVVGAYYRNPKGISSNPENLDRAVREVMEIRGKYQ